MSASKVHPLPENKQTRKGQETLMIRSRPANSKLKNGDQVGTDAFGQTETNASSET